MIVERRQVETVVVHGTLAGLLGGIILGLASVAATLLFRGSVADPFRFATSMVVGVEALDPGFPVGAAVVLGAAVHLSISTLLGIAFVGSLALVYQLSARWWLLVIYGSTLAFTAWEVSFLAAIPSFFPHLVGTLDLGVQLWNLVAYVGVYGPALGAYVALVRPGVVDDWRAAGAPAGTWPTRESEDG